MKKVVIDTNVLVSSLLSPHGNANKIMEDISYNKYKIVYSKEILEEYERVLNYDKLDLSPETQIKAIAGICKRGELIEPNTSNEPLSDEDDRVFYDVAKDSDAILITGNIKHYPSKPFIMNPSDFLKMIESK